MALIHRMQEKAHAGRRFMVVRQTIADIDDAPHLYHEYAASDSEDNALWIARMASLEQDVCRFYVIDLQLCIICSASAAFLVRRVWEDLPVCVVID